MERWKPRANTLNSQTQFCVVFKTRFGRPALIRRISVSISHQRSTTVSLETKILFAALIRTNFAKSLFRKENVNGATKKVSRR